MELLVIKLSRFTKLADDVNPAGRHPESEPGSVQFNDTLMSFQDKIKYVATLLDYGCSFNAEDYLSSLGPRVVLCCSPVRPAAIGADPFQTITKVYSH